MKGPDYERAHTGHGFDFSRFDTPGTGLGIRPLSAGWHEEGQPWAYTGVFSPFWRLYWAEHDRNYVEFENRRYVVGSESVLLIPAELYFHCGSSGSAAHLWVHFGVLGQVYRFLNTPVRVPCTESTLHLTSALRLMLQDSSAPRACYHLAHALLTQALQRVPKVPARPVPELLHRVLDYVHSHLDHNLQVQALARHAGYTKEHLAHLFKVHLGVPPSEYVRSCRVREAARRLAHTEASIDQIASDVGFKNRFHFSRIFRAHLQDSPAAFRARTRTGG